MSESGRRARYAVYSLAILAAFVLLLEMAARILAATGAVNLSKVIAMRTTPPAWERYFDDPSLFDGLAGLPVPIDRLVRIDPAGGVIETVPEMALIRPQRFPVERRPEDFRVLFLGGSSVVGHDMEEAYSFPYRIGKVLAARMPDRNVQVFNGGMDAGATCDAADLLARIGPVFRPDLVVVYAGHNDLIPLQVRNLPEFNHHGLRPAVLWAFEHLALLRVGAYVYFSFYPPHPEKLFHEFEAWYGRRNGTSWRTWERARRAIGENFHAHLVRITREAQALGAMVLLCSTTSNLNHPPTINIHGPDFPAEKQGEYADGLARAESLNVGGMFAELADLTDALTAADDRYARTRYLAGLARRNLGEPEAALREFESARDVTPVYPAMSVAPTFFAGIVRAAAEETGAAYLPTESAMTDHPAYAAAVPGSLFIDSIHPSPAGNRLLAELIVSRLTGLGWIPPGRREPADGEDG